MGERRIDAPDGPPFLLSTGSRGEFVRRADQGLYFDERHDPAIGEIPDSSADPGLSLWLLLRPEGHSTRSWIPAALIVLGGLLIVLGAGVIVRKQDPIGWMEVILGVLLVIGPVAAAANRLRAIRQRARVERERRAREEQERLRIVGVFAQRLGELAANPSPDTLAAVRRERKPEIPGEAVAPLGRAAVIQVGFQALGDVQKTGTAGLASRMREAVEAVGLSPGDAREAGKAVVQKVIWHLLADDRLNDERLNFVLDLARALELPPEHLDRELRAAEELRFLKGIAAKNLPVVESDGALKFGESCHHRTRGAVLKRSLRGALRQGKPFELYVTSRRVLLDGSPKESITWPEIFGLEVDVDRNLLMITLRDRRDPLLLQMQDPIRTAQIIDLASTLPPKPKGLI